MDDLRTEHANRETEVWVQFETSVLNVPRERWDDADVLPEWTVKEMLWHVAGWLDECSRHLEEMRAGTFVGEDDAEDDDTDERNAAFADQARAMDVGSVWSGLLAARERVRSGWDSLPEVTDRAIEEFASETYQHYEEHLPDLERARSS